MDSRRRTWDNLGVRSYKELIERYGLVAVLVYLSTSLCVFVPTLLALNYGFDMVGWLASWGIELPDAVLAGGNVLLAWGVVKATQIPRLVVTAAITPIVGQYVRIPMPGLGDDDASEDGDAGDGETPGTPSVEAPGESKAPEPKQA